MNHLDRIILRGDLFACIQQIQNGIDQGAIKTDKAVEYWSGMQVTLTESANELHRMETELETLRSVLASERLASLRLQQKVQNYERLQEELREENRNLRTGLSVGVFEEGIGLAGHVGDGDDDAPF